MKISHLFNQFLNLFSLSNKSNSPAKKAEQLKHTAQSHAHAAEATLAKKVAPQGNAKKTTATHKKKSPPRRNSK